MRGIYSRPQSPDVNFFKLPFDPVILTDLPAQTVEDRDAFHKLLITEYGKDTDSLDTVASCRCGGLKGTHNIGVMHSCGHRVEQRVNLSADSLAWVKCPEVAGAFFTPLAWRIFSGIFSAKNADWNGMAYLCKTSYKSAPATSDVAIRKQRRLDTLGFRGLDKVMENFDMFLEFAIAEAKKPHLEEFIRMYRNELTTTYLPLPTKVAFVIERTPLGDFTDPSLKSIMEAIQHIIALQNETKPPLVINRCVSIMEELRVYYDGIFSVIGRKSHWFRKAVYGTRMNFSWRTVITSRHDVHHYEELQIPYSQGCVVFRIHLMNVLVKQHGMSQKGALEYINRNTAREDPFLRKLLEDLIRATPNGEGFWATFTRYPTLSRGSTQLLRITGFSRSSTTISVLVLVAPNSDFDGDNMTGVALLSREQRVAFERLRPHYGIFNNSKPRTLNGNTKLPDATVSTWHAYTERAMFNFPRFGNTVK